MLEKNTVILDLDTYNTLRKTEENYFNLENDLKRCVVRFDKNGKKCSKNFYMDDPTKTVQIKIEKLAKILGIEDYPIEIVK